MSTTLPEIEERVRRHWPADPVALEVLRVVSGLELELSHYITIPLVVQRLDDLHGRPAATHAGDKSMLTLIYQRIEYLASELIGLLDPHFELQRDDNTSSDLDRRAVIDALRGGQLYDPDRGNPISDWEVHVIPYYSATELLKEILRDRR